jgi:hypothetical protein
MLVWAYISLFLIVTIAYYFMQAQMSHTCLFGLILSSSVLYSHIVGHTYPDELHELVWVHFLSTTAMESCKLRQAVAHLGLFGFFSSYFNICQSFFVFNNYLMSSQICSHVHFMCHISEVVCGSFLSSFPPSSLP